MYSSVGKCVATWCQSLCKYNFISLGDQENEVRVRCVILEWKAHDSPISFETFLFTVFYYIKPNQLSQRQHARIGSWVGIFKQSRLAAQI